MIIVVQIGAQLQGLIVDAVDDIVTIDLEAMQPPPDVGDHVLRRIIEGIATADDQMVMVLALASLEEGQEALARAA